MNDSHKIASQTEATNTSRVPVTPEAIVDLRYPADANLSPDGQRVAFVVEERIADQPKRTGRIWIVDTAGGEAQPLTRSKREESCPRWSPDSKQLAFISKGESEKDKPQLHLISAEGGSGVRFLSCATRAQHPRRVGSVSA